MALRMKATSRSGADGLSILPGCMQVNCHNTAAATFMAVLGDSTVDFNYYGPPEMYEKYVGVAVYPLLALYKLQQLHGEW